MKKAKIMLMAIAVLAVVGGALAFKTAKFHVRNVFATTPNGVCTTAPYVSAAFPGAITTTGTFYTTSTCPASGVITTVYLTNAQ